MDELPTCIRFMSANLGKPVSAFTKADWESAAIFSGNMADKFWDRLHPKPKKKGAPRRYSLLYRKLLEGLPRGKPGPNPGLFTAEIGAIHDVLPAVRETEKYRKWRLARGFRDSEGWALLMFMEDCYELLGKRRSSAREHHKTAKNALSAYKKQSRDS